MPGTNRNPRDREASNPGEARHEAMQENSQLYRGSREGSPRGPQAPPEPVLNRATIAAILQLVGLAGVMSQSDFALLVEVLVAVLPPLITLIGGYLARNKVTPAQQ